jgi:hypothetical protein
MAPKSVATFERDFDATHAYYQLDGVALEWVRSTSLLERVNRQLRRKFRQALSFGSTVGTEVALYLQVEPSSCSMEAHILVADFPPSLLGFCLCPPLEKDTISIFCQPLVKMQPIHLLGIFHFFQEVR